jgi:hypothetical protein
VHCRLATNKNKMIIKDSNKKTKLLVAAVIAVIVLLVAGFFLWRIWQKDKNVSTDYIIPNVPYFGIHNHKGNNNVLGPETPSAVASILEYWNPGKNNLQEINDNVLAQLRYQEESSKYLSDFDKIKEAVYTLGDYNSEVVNLKISDLKTYVNQTIRTPLLVFLPVKTDQPIIINYSPVSVLIGVKEKESKLVFHNFWLGNNLEISYEDYSKMIDRMTPIMRNNYLVIQPKNLKEKLKEVEGRRNTPYPPRTSIMERGSEMFKNYAIAEGGSIMDIEEPTKTYLEKIIQDPEFENYFPPYMKVLTYSRLAQMYLLGNKDNLTAIKYAQMSIDLNHNIDQPFKDWMGYECAFNKPSHYGESSRPYVVMGDIQSKQNNISAAKDAYTKAFEIYPRSSVIRNKLQLTK